MYAADPGPVNPPTIKPFIRLYHGFLFDPKPEDMVDYYLIHSSIQVDPDRLQEELKKERQNCQVIVFLRQEEGNRNLFVYLDRKHMWGDIDRRTRKIIEDMTVDDR